MNTENLNRQPDLTTTQIEHQLIENTGNSQSGKIFKTIGGVLLLLVVSAGAYYLGMQRNIGATKKQVDFVAASPSVLPSNTPTNVQSQSDPQVTTWKNQTIESSRTAPGSDVATTLYVDFQIPSNWTMQPVRRESNCIDYIISNDDQTAKMNVKSLCSGWSATYSPWPPDATIVRKQVDAADSPSDSYRVRYFDSNTNQYKYVDAYVDTGTTPDENSKIMDALTIIHDPYRVHTFATFFVDLTYSGDPAQKNQQLKLADKIVASMKLR